MCNRIEMKDIVEIISEKQLGGLCMVVVRKMSPKDFKQFCKQQGWRLDHEQGHVFAYGVLEGVATMASYDLRSNSPTFFSK